MSRPAVDAPQFADGIENDAVVFGPDRFPGLHIAALDHSDAVLDAFVDDEIGLIDIARGDDQFGFREMVPYLDESLVDRAVLPFVVLPAIMMGYVPSAKPSSWRKRFFPASVTMP